jgi:hypothetical protein
VIERFRLSFAKMERLVELLGPALSRREGRRGPGHPPLDPREKILCFLKVASSDQFFRVTEETNGVCRASVH